MAATTMPAVTSTGNSLSVNHLRSYQPDVGMATEANTETRNPTTVRTASRLLTADDRSRAVRKPVSANAPSTTNVTAASAAITSIQMNDALRAVQAVSSVPYVTTKSPGIHGVSVSSNPLRASSSC